MSAKQTIKGSYNQLTNKNPFIRNDKALERADTEGLNVRGG